MAPITWSVIECIQQKLVLKFEPWFGTRIRVCLVSVFPLNWQFLGFWWGNRFVVLCSWWKAWQMALWVRWWLTGRIGKTKNNAGASLHWAVNVNKTNCQTSHSKLWWNNFCVCCYQWLLRQYLLHAEHRQVSAQCHAHKSSTTGQHKPHTKDWTWSKAPTANKAKPQDRRDSRDDKGATSAERQSDLIVQQKSHRAS